MLTLASTDNVARLLTADGDLDISANRSQFVSGLAGFVAGANARLAMVRGEWFADRARGLPLVENDYVKASEAILGQPFDEVKVRTAYAAAIGETPGFGKMLKMSVTFTASTRRVLVTWQARTQFGDTPVVVQEF